MTATSRSTRSARSGDVFEITDRRGDHEQRAGHFDRRGLLYHWRIGADGPARPATAGHFRLETMIASEPLPHFVNDLLGYLHETHPTHATLDGVHTTTIFSRISVARASMARFTRSPGYLRRLDEINRDALTAVERLEHRMLTSNLQARMFELEEIRTWERNPQLYSDILASSLAGQALFTYAPAAERARRVLSKLRQTPRLIQTARDNIKDPPGIFVKVGIETMRGALKFIEDELPRAFADLDDLHLLGDLADAQTEASNAVALVHAVPRERSSARRRAPLSASVATSSRRSCGSTRGSPSRSIGCSRLRRAS